MLVIAMQFKCNTKGEIITVDKTLLISFTQKLNKMICCNSVTGSTLNGDW